MQATLHNRLIDCGFTRRTDVDPHDQHTIRTVYTRHEGWFRIRAILPKKGAAQPALWIDLRDVPQARGWNTSDYWLVRRSELAHPTVASVVDNAIGFLSVIRVY